MAPARILPAAALVLAGLAAPAGAAGATPPAAAISPFLARSTAPSERPAAPPPPLGPARLYDARAVLAAGSGPAAAEPSSPPPEAKDPRRAMLYSLLLPGLGEMWLGHTTRAKFFLAAEAGIWITWGVFRQQGSHREDLYHEYASVFAGVPDRDDEDYYRVIGNFASADGPFSANEQVRREARAIYPNDRARQEAYVLENGYFGEDAWEWTSEDALDRYREMRRSSLDAYNHADLSIGLAVANRLLSVVDAGFLAASRRRAAEEGKSTLGWNLDVGPDGPGATVTLRRGF